MSELFLYFSDGPQGLVQWQVRDRRQAAQAQQGSLEEAARFIGKRRCTLIISAQMASMTHIVLPTKSPTKARQAAPFVLEETLAEDVDTLLFALGPIQQHNQYPVVAVQRQALQALLERCQEQQLHISSIQIDALCLPWQPQTVTILELPQHWLLRWGEYHARCVPKALGSSILLNDFGDDYQWQLFGSTAIPLADGTLLRPEPLPNNSELHIALLQPAKHPIDLRQQEAEGPLLGAAWQPWRAVAVLAVLCLGLWCIERGLWLQKRQAELNNIVEQQHQLYRQAYPKARIGADPARQLQARLRKLQRQGGTPQDTFLPALQVAASIVEQQLEEVYFRNGKVEIVVRANNYEALDNITKRLNETASHTAALQSATREQGSVLGKLRMEPKT